MRVLIRLAALTALSFAAGCASPVDSEQLRICRLVLPALHPPGTEIREVRIGPANLGRQGVGIEYAAREPGERARSRYAACGFGGTTFERDRRDLTAVDTDEGPLGEARLLYLKRFWLPQAGTAPETGQPPPVPDIVAPVAYAAQQFVNAIALCAVYALLATAYALIYGLVGRLNLAFGEIAVIGAYGAIGGLAAVLALGFGNPIGGLTVAFTIAAGLACLWSWLVGRTIVAPLHAGSRQGQPILVATAALAVTIQEFLRLFQGVREHWLPPLFNTPIPLARADRFVVTVTPMQLTVATLALAAAAGVLMLLARTRFGRHWRAFADDPGAAALFGVAGNRLLATTFALAGLMAHGWEVRLTG